MYRRVYTQAESPMNREGSMDKGGHFVSKELSIDGQADGWPDGRTDRRTKPDFWKA